MGWRRLADEVVRRRVEIGYATRVSFIEASGIGARTLGDIENVRRDSYDPATLVRLERALDWPSGRVQQILETSDESQPLDPSLFPPYVVPGDRGADLIVRDADGNLTEVQLKRVRRGDGPQVGDLFEVDLPGSSSVVLVEGESDAGVFRAFQRQLAPERVASDDGRDAVAGGGGGEHSVYQLKRHTEPTPPAPPAELLWQLGLASPPEPVSGQHTLAEILRLIHRDDFPLAVLLFRSGLDPAAMLRVIVRVRARREEQAIELLHEVADLVRDAGGDAPDPVWPPVWLVGEG